MSHTYTHLVIHVVFSTKDRLPLISPETKNDLLAYIGGIVREEGAKALIVNGTNDHLHMLVSLPATLAVANLMRVVKTNSSRWVHEKWPDRGHFGWQQGYGAFSVSHSALSAVEAYITNQEEHHRKITFQEEFLALLKKHEIPYDERYIWT